MDNEVSGGRRKRRAGRPRKMKSKSRSRKSVSRKSKSRSRSRKSMKGGYMRHNGYGPEGPYEMIGMKYDARMPMNLQYHGGAPSGGVRRFSRGPRMYRAGANSGGAFSGGCGECGGVCGGAQNPSELMNMVMQHVEDGNMSGGEVAQRIIDYAGNGMQGAGFFSDLIGTIGNAIPFLSPILNAVPVVGPLLSLGASQLGSAARVGSEAIKKIGGKRRKSRKTRRPRSRKVLKRMA